MSTQQLLIATAAAGGGSSGTWNPSDQSNVTLSGGDLVATASTATGNGGVRGTSSHSGGDWYFEVTVTGSVIESSVGLANTSSTLNGIPGANSNSWGYYVGSGGSARGYYNGAFAWSASPQFVVNDVLGIRLNGTTIECYLNGTLKGTFTSVSGTLYPIVGFGTTSSPARVWTLNTGASAFGSLPSGSTAWG